MSEWRGRVWTYIGPDDASQGVVVDPRCPTCRRICSGHLTSVVYDEWHEGVDHFNEWKCKRCGPFQPDVLGWAGDFA